MKTYGELIHATTANPLGSVPWGRITAKPDRFYLHVFDWPKDNQISVPLRSAGSVKAWMLADGQRELLKCEPTSEGVKVTLKPAFQNPYASVAVLEVGGGAPEPRGTAK